MEGAMALRMEMQEEKRHFVGPFGDFSLLIDGLDIDTGIRHNYISVENRLLNIDKSVATYCLSDKTEIVLAVNSAKKAFEIFRKATIDDRLNVIRTLKNKISRNMDLLIDICIAEGLSVKSALWQLDTILNVIVSEDNFELYRYLARPYDNLRKEGAYMYRQPLGVLGIVTPFNGAILLAGLGIVSQIISGNTSVIKAPSTNPVSTLIFGKLVCESLQENKMPAGVINVIVGKGEDVVDQWLDKRLIEGLVFYGGSGTGLKIGSKAIRQGIKPILELAGSDACVVHEDADLDEAAVNIVKGRFLASGQVCISIKRLIAHESIHDQLIERILFHVRDLKVGLPSDPATDIIPLGHQKTLSLIGSAIEDAVSKGGTVQCGGYRMNYLGEKDINGLYFAPTVVTNVSYNDDIMQNEILGPVIPVTKYRSIHEAIKITNSSKYGLRASIWTKNRGIADRFIDEVDVGSVLVNKFHLWFGDDVAHLGGMKASSGTNNGAKYFIEEMLKKKYVNKENLIHF